MRQKTLLERLAGIQILGIERGAAEWTVSATGAGRGTCPACGTPSDARHSTYVRHLQDLPLQGVRVTVHLAVARLRCRNSGAPGGSSPNRCLGLPSRGAAKRGACRTLSGFSATTQVVDRRRGFSPTLACRSVTTPCSAACDDQQPRTLEHLCVSSGSMIGHGARARATEPSWWIWSAGRLWTFCLIAPRPARPSGCGSIRRWRS
jgi:hypothetical protein